jgi:hypothetical protein
MTHLFSKNIRFDFTDPVQGKLFVQAKDWLS